MINDALDEVFYVNNPVYEDERDFNYYKQLQ